MENWPNQLTASDEPRHACGEPGSPPSSRYVIEELARRLGGRQLIVVSNREPYIHRFRGDEPVWERSTGGLVAALDPLLQVLEGLWIAWGSGDADPAVADERGRTRVPPDSPRYTLRRVWLSEREAKGYYLGYANQVLWPACHLLIERIRFRRRDWAAYRRVNERFARVIAEEAAAGALVWVHDYHLSLTPSELRRLRPDVTVTAFWHIPWPPAAVFHSVPHGEAVVRGLLGADLLGFQTPEHRDAFTASAAELRGVEANGQDLRFEGRRVSCRAFPISIDYEGFRKLAAPRIDPRQGDPPELDPSPSGQRLWRRLAAAVEERQAAGVAPGEIRIGVAVDRVDYTKGLPVKLEALDFFFRAHPEFRHRLLFIQVGAPSRMEIEDYQQLAAQLRRRAATYNRRYAAPLRYGPILYVDERQDPATLARLYRLADFALVNSVQDGMNLVAKEFVAAQIEGDGVLILSTGAGATFELREAITVNPLDPEGIGEAVHQALTLPEAERRRRMREMQERVRGHDIFHWAGEILNAAHEMGQRAGSAAPLSNAAG